MQDIKLPAEIVKRVERRWEQALARQAGAWSEQRRKPTGASLSLSVNGRVIPVAFRRNRPSLNPA
jgi:hypothetical protein